MALYCDTNLLVRLYVDLPNSAVALHQLGQYQRRGIAKIPVTWLHQLETIHAFEQLVFLTRNGDGMRMTPEKAALAAAQNGRNGGIPCQVIQRMRSLPAPSAARARLGP